MNTSGSGTLSILASRICRMGMWWRELRSAIAAGIVALLKDLDAYYPPR